MKKYWLFFIFLISSVSYAYAIDIGALLEIARGQAEIQKSYENETKIYNKIEKAVNAGLIKNGQSSNEIKAKYGEPVVIIPDTVRAGDDWIYKPAKSSFFQGEKIDLFFDKKGLLYDIKTQNN